MAYWMVPVVVWPPLAVAHPKAMIDSAIALDKDQH
jgi:hypothetical protein